MVSKYQTWDDNLQQHASAMEEKYKIPPGALTQIVKQESSGRINVGSPKGAYGLTQLMPGTAKQMGVTDITDPYQQLEGGAKYYSQLLHGPAKGDEIVAAAMYNSGPNKQAYKTGNLSLLPKETQNYMNAFASARGGEVEKPKTIAGKIANAIIPAAYGSSKSSNEGVSIEDYIKQQSSPVSNEGVSIEDYIKQQSSPVSNEGVSIEDYIKQQSTSPTNETKKPNLFDKPATDLPSYLEKQQLALQVMQEAIKNVPSSAYELGKGTLESGVNAIQNYDKVLPGLGNILQGEALKAKDLISGSQPSPENQQAYDAANKVNQALYNRYGSGENITNTIMNDPVGLLADYTSGGIAAKVGLAPARAAIELVPHPVSGVSNILAEQLGKGASSALGKMNKSNLSKADIERAYQVGKGKVESPSGQLDMFQQTPSFKNTVWDKPLLPKWENMSDSEKAMMMGSAGLLSPTSLALYSPKLVAGAAYGTGVARRVPASINKAIDITPAKGLLNQYEEEQQNNAFRQQLNSLLR